MAHMIRVFDTENKKVRFVPEKLSKDKELMKRYNLIIQDSAIKEDEIMKASEVENETKIDESVNEPAIQEPKKRGRKAKTEK